MQVWRETLWDRLARQAMALSFQCLFSLIPVIVIGLTLLTQFISAQEVTEIEDWLSQHMLPAQALEVAPEILRVATAVDVGTLGIAGALGLIVVAATLFWTLTHIVDDIWRVRQKPTLAYRAFGAVVILLLLPTIAGLSVYFSQLLVRLPWSIDFFVPVAVNVVGLWLVYRYVPSTPVDSRAALASALIVGVFLELAKVVFGFYMVRLSVTIQGLYGAIALIPLSLFWLYLLWLFFLFGVELTYTLQNLPELWMRDAPKDDAAVEGRAGGPLALMAVHRVYRTGGISLSELASRLAASPEAVRTALDRLEEGKFLRLDDKGLYVPARPSGEIAVVDVLSVFTDTRAPEHLNPGDQRLEDVLERLRAARDAELEDMTLADLLN